MPISIEEIEKRCKDIQWTIGQREVFECDHVPSPTEVINLVAAINISDKHQLGYLRSGRTITIHCTEKK